MVDMMTLTLDEQLDALRARGLPADRLRAAAAGLAGPAPERAVLAFSREVLSTADAAARVERRGEAVVLGHLEPGELVGFVPIPAVEVPAADAYLAVGVDLGAESRDVRPEDALRDLLAAGRSPLTIDEGIALVLQQPEAIATSWGFSMAGSRRGDQRVPALWVAGDGRPKLGWCWDRNPHTWLGTASCARRLA